MHRAEGKVGLSSKLIVYVLAGTFAGMLAGAALGWMGSLLTSEFRSALAVAFSLVAIGLGLAELSGHRVALIQVDRETPYAWLRPGPLRWAMRNGAAIGFGAATRLGFWLWFVIPIGAMLSGNPLIGALGWGLYALVRTASVGGILLLVQRRQLDTKGSALLRQSERARGLVSAQLLAIGLTAMLIVGL